MKKIITVSFAIMLCLSLTSMAYAAKKIAAVNGDMVSTSFGGGVYAPSTGVTVQVVSISSEYCAGAQHASSTPTNKGLQFHTLYSSPEQPANLAIANGPTACTATNALPTGMSPAP